MNSECVPCPTCQTLVHPAKLAQHNLAKHADALAALKAEVRREVIEALKEHWLFGIECHHEAKTDQAICACGVKFPERENVGKAVEDWAKHALALASPSEHKRSPDGMHHSDDCPKCEGDAK